MDHLLLFIVGKQGSVVREEEIALAGFQDYVEIPVEIGYGNSLEAAVFRRFGYAVHSGNPYLAVFCRVYNRNLVVRQAKAVVSAEKLLEFQAVEPVQAALRTHPDMAVLVLGK